MPNAPEIHQIHLNFQGNGLALSVFLIESSEGPILVETGPHSTVADVEAGLAKLGYTADDVKHVLLTHIHLDHGGAAWYFAEKGAQIYLHPLGYPHYHQPEKLLASAKRIYQDRMDELWGTLKPIAESNLTQIEDGQIISISDHEFEAIYSPGHAQHHIAWKLGDVLFTGDVAGVRINDGPVIPPCPPPDIYIDVWKNSIRRILERSDITTFYLTHGGPVTDLRPHMEDLMVTLDKYAEFVKPYALKGTPSQEIIQPFMDFVKKDLIERGVTDETELETIELANPSFMGVAGLMRYWKKKLAS